jgi:DNA-binding NtrC family response regulator
MSPARILVVDDEPDIRKVLTTLLEKEGYDVTAVPDGPAALEAQREAPYDLLLTDLNLPRMNGNELLKKVKDRDPGIVGIVFTGYGTVQTAIEAMKAGAFDYILKPFNGSEVSLLIKRALEYKGLQKENVQLKRSLEGRFRFQNLIGSSEGMRQVCEMIEKVAESDSTILLLGESGTGKELVAKTIHYNSERRHKPMIPINCGAIPENLLESELFGHEKGAFTGAGSMRIGRFELPDGGTIFLDEIGEMSPALQVKLLRVLQQ